MASKKACLICGENFDVFPSQMETRKYCSRKCFYQSERVEHKLTSCEKSRRWREKQNNHCPVCDKLISPRRKHCREHTVYPDRKGPNSPKWKGGKYTIAGSGYVQVNLGNGNHTREHRLVWEQTHNCKLPKSWVVHHLNGIRNDNRPENLVAMPKKDHAKIPVSRNHLPNNTFIKALQKRIRELEQLHLFAIG